MGTAAKAERLLQALRAEAAEIQRALR